MDRRDVRQKLEEPHIVCVDGHGSVLYVVEAVCDIVTGELIGGLVGVLLGELPSCTLFGHFVFFSQLLLQQLFKNLFKLII